jgi:hypothetical protein
LMSLLMLTSCRNPKNQEQIEQNHPQSKGKWQLWTWVGIHNKWMKRKMV